MTTLEDIESRIDLLQKSIAMLLLKAYAELKEILNERNSLLPQWTLIRRNTGWDS